MKTDEKREMGRRIAAWREFVGKKRSELAEAVRVTPEAVIQWETGDTSPTHANLAALVEALGISLATFWGSVPGSPDKNSRKASKRKAA